LAHLSKRQLQQDVEQFATEFQLTHILPQLHKGALIARDPTNFESVDGLTAEESTIISDEVLHKWRQPGALYFTIILCSVGAAVQYVHFLQTPRQSRYIYIFLFLFVGILLIKLTLGDGIRLDPMVLICPFRMP
jgi:hypothetical protein